MCGWPPRTPTHLTTKHPTRPPTQPTNQDEEGEDGDGQAPGEKEPEPPAWDAYPRGPEWEKEAEANAAFLGGLGAIDAVVDRVRYVSLFVPPCMWSCLCVGPFLPVVLLVPLRTSQPYGVQTNERREYTYMVELDCIARHRRTKLALQARAKACEALNQSGHSFACSPPDRPSMI